MSNLPEGMEAMAKVVSIYALANDYAEAKGPQSGMADYWRVFETTKEALGTERLVYVSRDAEGIVTLWSLDMMWSYRNPPASAFRLV